MLFMPLMIFMSCLSRLTTASCSSGLDEYHTETLKAPAGQAAGTKPRIKDEH
jgi:hypothetical protein